MSQVMCTIRLGSFGFLIHGATGHYFFRLMFFGYLNLTQGKSFKDYKNKIKADLKTAMMGSWTVWVPAHTINFAIIPPSLRLLYINSIQIGYSVFLSFLGNKKIETDDEKKELF